MVLGCVCLALNRRLNSSSLLSACCAGQVRQVIQDVYGIDRSSLSTWFKNRSKKPKGPKARRLEVRSAAGQGKGRVEGLGFI